MGRRRAHHGGRPASAASVAVADDLPVSARVAWCYLGALLAAVGTGALAVLSNQTLAVVACAGAGGDDGVASCRLGVVLWVAVVGYLLCLLPACLLLKLGWWNWVAMTALIGLLVAADAATEWWWWAAAALVPAAAALISAEWGRGRSFRNGQLGVLILLLFGAALALVWWYLQP